MEIPKNAKNIKISKDRKIDVEDDNTKIKEEIKVTAVPYISALDLKTPPHYKFNQLRTNMSSFASCFAPSTSGHDFSEYRPSSTTHINHTNDNMFRPPNDLRRKSSNQTKLENPNTIENSKLKEENKTLAQKPKIVCNCKKSKCLKLYCECFILGLFCDGCNCACCLNTVENKEERNRVMDSLKEKNPAAFKPKIEYNIDDEKQKVEKTKHIRGCNCSKTQCLKKYCECYQSGVLCTDLCKCTECKNDDIEKLKRKNNKNHIFKTVSNEIEENKDLNMQNISYKPPNLMEKNSFSQEFFCTVDDQKAIKNYINNGRKTITSKNDNSKSECSVGEGDEENECTSRSSSSSIRNNKKNQHLSRKRKRIIKKSDNNLQITPKARANIKIIGSNSSESKSNQNLSTGMSENNKRLSKLKNSTEQIAKKLNLNFS